MSNTGIFAPLKRKSGSVAEGLILSLSMLHGSNDSETRGTVTDVARGITGELAGFDFSVDSGWTSGGLLFDGTDDYMSIPSGSVPELSALTIEIGILPGDISEATRYMLLTKGTASQDWHLEYDCRNTRKIALGVSGKTFAAPVTLEAGRSYHLVATFDGNSASIYLNGALLSFGALAAVWARSTQPYIIGAYRPTVTSAPTLPYPGLITGVRIYNRALTADEVEQCGLAGF